MCAVNRLKFDTFYRQLRLFLRQGKGRGGRREGGGGRGEERGGRAGGGRGKMEFKPTTLYTLDKMLYQLSYQGSSAGWAQIFRRTSAHLMNMYMLECVDYIPHWEF